jgi:FtsZ-binding cell division protein ZapB
MCLFRELVSKLRSMTETIKMLSTENVALREENDTLLAHSSNGRYLIREENDTLIAHTNNGRYLIREEIIRG